MQEAFGRLSKTNKVVLLGRLSKVGSGAHFIYTQFFKNPDEANKLYVAVLPSLKRTISNQGFNSKESQALVELLIDAAPYGAKRRNFKKRYFSNDKDWQTLPADPNDIPFGSWH